MEFELLAEVEDLERPLVCFKRDNLLSPVHKSTVGLDRSPDNFIIVLKVDDYDFRSGISDLLTNADVVVGFKSLVANEYALVRSAAAGPLTQELKPIEEGFVNVSWSTVVLRDPSSRRWMVGRSTYINSDLRQLNPNHISMMTSTRECEESTHL